ncbi:hypothetical protein SAMD00019534_094920 [Acytostelium subglobosum LB1]|uniref:hypothetical protein n=1 Tax=Acytostelium subglobosum LB1 TaxID=1410327 RepID=UPI0006450542|nr:hypothetical protein SAMD00019534_094920 [Acytostelium subglobosum LB1]GAM26317.1 hypothetical protein SAMD00019534_094920 [Acytostelium subglobosum LB1]|eukprot:XP_012750871.1 hypothetical protein SAMD00019534_094920 [Acytostelium subglobosum LB1]
MSTSSNYAGPWTKEALCKGDGFIVEGIIRKYKMHSMFVNTKPSIHDTTMPTRFFTAIVEVDTTIKRNFRDGIEIPPKMQRATAINKGFLNKFDRVEAKLVEKVDHQGLAAAIGSGTGKALPIGFHDDSLQSLHPIKPGHFEFWLDAEKNLHKDLKVGDEIRIKTIGNSVFAESIIKMDGLQISNFSGDTQLLNSWSNNLTRRGDIDDDEPVKKPTPQDDDDEQDWS